MSQTALSEPVAGAAPLAAHRPLNAAVGTAIGATAIGAFLPWASVGSLSFNGTEGGGLLNLILAGIGMTALLVARGRRWGMLLNVVTAALAALIVAVNLSDVERFADSIGTVSTGIGLWISLVGTVAWLIVSVVGLFRRRRPSA